MLDDSVVVLGPKTGTHGSVFCLRAFLLFDAVVLQRFVVLPFICFQSFVEQTFGLGTL